LDPGSGNRIRDLGKNVFQIPDPGVQKAPDPGSGFLDPDPQHCENVKGAETCNLTVYKKG